MNPIWYLIAYEYGKQRAIKEDEAREERERLGLPEPPTFWEKALAPENARRNFWIKAVIYALLILLFRRVV